MAEQWKREIFGDRPQRLSDGMAGLRLARRSTGMAASRDATVKRSDAERRCGNVTHRTAKAWKCSVWQGKGAVRRSKALRRRCLADKALRRQGRGLRGEVKALLSHSRLVAAEQRLGYAPRRSAKARQSLALQRRCFVSPLTARARQSQTWQSPGTARHSRAEALPSSARRRGAGATYRNPYHRTGKARFCDGEAKRSAVSHWRGWATRGRAAAQPSLAARLGARHRCAVARRGGVP